MISDNITRLAYLNTLPENKKPFDLLMDIIEIECYPYDFDELGLISKDKNNIKDIIFKKYNIEIEEYALKKWLPKNFVLKSGKLLKKGNEDANIELKIQSIQNGETEFLNKVSEIRKKFVTFALESFNKKLTKEDSKNIFDEYIYTVSKDKSIKAGENQNYYIFQSFLKQLYQECSKDLEIIENFGIANQIQDLILNSDSDNPRFLDGCSIFIDTPLVMKYLGYDGIGLSNIYYQFFEDLKKAGAELKIFEHTFEELWGILFNFKRCVAQNILYAKGVNTFLKARIEFLNKKDTELSLDKEIVRKSLENKFGPFIDISDSDNLSDKCDFKDWSFDIGKFEECLKNADPNYNNYKTRMEKDIQSISSIFRLRRSKEKIHKADTFKEGKYYLLVDNYALVDAIKNYYKKTSEKKHKNELLLENTIIFHLWQNLSNTSSLNKSLFRGKCFVLNTIDDNFKDTLYREVRKIEAYDLEIDINQELINSPDLEDEVYAASIKKGSYDKEYISKTIKNKISEKEKKVQQELEKKNRELSEKQSEIELLKVKHVNTKNETEKKYLEELNQQKIQAKSENQKSLQEYQVALISRKIEELARKPLFKIQIFFLKIFKKDFDKEKFLKDKAIEIIGI